MGAWGEKPFENDAAQDFLAAFEAGGVAELRSALEGVADTDDDSEVDVDDGSAAIAAAEIVAAALGLGTDRVTKAVKAWLEGHQQAITVHHLPSYSPELNPDEHLNRALKSTLSHLPSAKEERSLQKQIIGRLRSCQKQPGRIRSFFTSSSTKYAA